MASGRFQDFQTDVHLAENDWRIAVGNPYIDDYTVAYDKYSETLKKQHEADKAAGELFVTAACLATGSVLLASIGSVAIEMIAKRTIVTIARKTLNDSMFRLFRTLRKNDGVAFAVGTFIDKAKDKVKDKAKEVITEFMSSADNILSPNPVVQYSHMDSFMRANVNCAIRMARIIEGETTLSEAEKDDHYKMLRAAPFFGKPARRSPPFKATMPEIIELTFYLSAMMETDSLVKVGAGSYTPDGNDTAKSTSTPIAQRPLAPDYPKAVMPAPTYTSAHGAYQYVAIDRAGSEVQKRTNELSNKIAGFPIYSSTFFGLGGPADTEKQHELEAADRLLSLIAIKMKPLDPFEAIH